VHIDDDVADAGDAASLAVAKPFRMTAFLDAISKIPSC
jgi:hypothetical protein